MEKIKIESEYLENLNNPDFMKIMEQDFPMKVRYWFARALEAMRGEAKAYFETKNKIVDMYAKKDEEGNPLSPDGGRTVIFGANRSTAEKEFADLKTTEIELPIGKIKLPLQACPKNLSARSMEWIFPLVDIDDTAVNEEDENNVDEKDST